MSRTHCRGFSIIEAVVALSLFAIMLVGATATLSIFQLNERSASSTALQADMREVFLQDWANFARQEDAMNELGERPDDSILDGVDHDFLADVDFESSSAALRRQVRDWETRLESELNPRTDQWRLTVASAAGAYRELTLTTASGVTRSWLICCDS